MQVDSGHIGYCTNVHPGESLADLTEVIEEHIPAVAEQLDHKGPFGAGLRLGNGLTEALTKDDRAFKTLVESCQRQAVYVFTVNGFPYGDFQASSVKTAVYDPDWRTQERLEYTLSLAALIARLPGPEQRTISTVAGGYSPHTNTREAKALMAHNMTHACEGLARIENETGVQIRLCLEPEPWTTMETTEQTIRFFHDYLKLESALVRRHLGVCYDCCHQAVLFEDAKSSLLALREAGITVGKVQISSALHLETPSNPKGRSALMAFAEPRYLHQVVGLTRDGILRCADLPQLAKPSSSWRQAEAWRCHFHVPVQWRGNEELGTTRADWEEALKVIKEQGLPYPHFEIETYTWSVLPPALRPDSKAALQAAISEEFRAVMPWLKNT